MIKRVIRQGLVKYEKEEADLRQEAILEIARIELEEKDAEKRNERISAVLQSMDQAVMALRQRHIDSGGGAQLAKAE